MSGRVYEKIQDPSLLNHHSHSSTYNKQNCFSADWKLFNEEWLISKAKLIFASISVPNFLPLTYKKTRIFFITSI